jgi:hypothetical protein
MVSHFIKCCGLKFRYYPDKDRLGSEPPNLKKAKLLHECPKLHIWRANLTVYFKKVQADLPITIPSPITKD